jgi:preprotein translocase subunit YajC
MIHELFTALSFLAEAAGGASGEAAKNGGGDAPNNPLGQLLMMFAIIFFIFWLIIWRPESRKRKNREHKIRSLKKGDQVVTTGGIYGKVLQVEEDKVLVQIDKNKDVRVRFAKSSVFDVTAPGSEEKAEESKQG